MGINFTHSIPIYSGLTNLTIFFKRLLSLNFQNNALFFQPQQGLKMINDRPKTPFLNKERWGFVVYGRRF